MASPDLAESIRVLQALEATVREEGPALAARYAERRGEKVNRDSLSDGHLLGAAATSRFLRRLAARRPANVKRAKPDRMGRPTFISRSPFLDRLARPGTSIEALLPKNASPVDLLERSREARTPSVAYTDALPPSISLNLALSEVFVENRTATLLVGDELLADIVTRALAPLVAEKLASVRFGTVDDAVEVGRSEKAERVVGVGSRATLEALEAVVGEAVAGFPTDVPSTFAIAPFPYDKSELARMARLATAELLAPPCGTIGVEIVVSRTWIQRSLFADLTRKALKQAGGASRVRVVRAEDQADASAILHRGPNPSGDEEPCITIVEVDADHVVDFFERTSRHLEAVSERGERWLVTAFAHPMELERRTFEDELEAFLGSIAATTLGINARASTLYLDGALPIGRRGNTVQNALGLRGVDRAVIESPLRWSACEAETWGAARARYDTTPTFGRAAGLGLRALFT